MINPFYEQLAKLVINYSIKVKTGDRVFILGPTLAEELFRALYVEIIKAGGHPLLLPSIEGQEELLFKYGSDEQLPYIDNVRKQINKEFDCMIVIDASYNTKKLGSINPQVIAKRYGTPEIKELWDTFYNRVAIKEARWVAIPFPCHAYAQEANMDLFSYAIFMKKALFLDKEDPIKEWENLKCKQDKLVEYLDKADKIRVLGEDTDLRLSVKGRKWINCSGQENLPDGEVYTGPIENSVNGHIRFTYPGIYRSNEIENIYLEFKNGKVIHATAYKGQELLQEVLKVENADRIGEFAIGTNYGIIQFTKQILFDEKIGGTMHCALGDGLKETGSCNESAIHWDILKDMKKSGSKIIADEKVIYEEGNWKI
ncbi:MAG: aminopeptidase [Candidatus Odinarchaeota archaeon]